MAAMPSERRPVVAGEHPGRRHPVRNPHPAELMELVASVRVRVISPVGKT
jgi:hypothetical protein